MCSATGRIWPLWFMPLYIVYDSFSLAMVLNAVLLHWFSTRNIRITAPSRKCGNDYFVFPELSPPTPGCLVQVSFEYLRGWRSHSLPAHLFQFFITLMRIFFSLCQSQNFLFQIVSIAFHPSSVHLSKGSGSVFSKLSLAHNSCSANRKEKQNIGLTCPHGTHHLTGSQKLAVHWHRNIVRYVET